GSVSATTLVTTSATRTAAAAAQNRRRSAPFAIFLFRLAADAQPGVREGVQPVEADVLAALLALTVLLRRGVQAAQRLVHVPEVAALLRREQERLLLLHGVGALVGHVERVAREVAVGGLEAGVEGFAVIAELLHYPVALLVQPLLEVLQLLLGQALGLGFRRHLSGTTLSSVVAPQRERVHVGTVALHQPGGRHLARDRHVLRLELPLPRPDGLTTFQGEQLLRRELGNGGRCLRCLLAAALPQRAEVGLPPEGHQL